ncbi:MAG: hypothetical protein DSY76_09360 [Bacteroidetes bacterium]|nr:MAG: hypothetical protein DSY76_09360 [Bacteroidota bacterium]
MRKIVNVVFVLLMGFYFSNPMMIDQDQAAKITFDKTVHDFGKVKKGAEELKCTFTYTNTGNDMLFISRVRKSCGCTLPVYSKEPIAPGQSATIEVGYTTTDVVGVFNKKITVFTNAVNNAVVLTIKGEIVE